MKLLELPIYALSKEELQKRVEKKKQSIINKFPNADEEIKEEVSGLIDKHLFPSRVWDYNHIIGYLVLCLKGSDFQFNLYLPPNVVDGKTFRYYWNSKKRIFVVNAGNPCYHFCVFHMDGDELRKSICDYMIDIEKEFKKQKWYIDIEMFYNVISYIDFDKLCQLGITNN